MDVLRRDRLLLDPASDATGPSSRASDRAMTDARCAACGLRRARANEIPDVFFDLLAAEARDPEPEFAPRRLAAPFDRSPDEPTDEPTDEPGDNPP